MARLPELTARHALFLDFDGTLVEIAPRPEDVVLAPDTRAALGALSRALGGAVAVISGRDIAVIDAHLAPLVLPVAGSHGAERRMHDGRTQRAEADPAAPDRTALDRAALDRAALDRAAAKMADFAAPHDLQVEKKHGAVTLHFRAKPGLEADAMALARDLAAKESALRLIPGKMVAELALAGHDKGGALRAYMAEPPFAGRVPLMAGDDTTDEDAMAVAMDTGGTAIRIGAGESKAPHRAADTATFLAWMSSMAKRLEGEAA
ncbi:MAG: trehalose-phosphatase [Pseudomonadota bacterium]